MTLLRWIIGLSLLAFQVGAIVYAFSVESRYFCWAPFDQQTRYRLEVTANGKSLTLAEMRDRYRRGFDRKGYGTDNRSVQHVKDIIAYVETHYHSDDRAIVVMVYTINGKEEQRWHFPPR